MQSTNTTKFRSIKQLWPLLLPVLLLLPGLAEFAYPSQDAPYSDMAVSHYPNAIFLKGALTEWRSLPLWSPTILSGYPFAANPLAGLWYLPGWLIVFLPLALGFNLLVIAHLLWGGVGMYKLLRKLDISNLPALFGALAFESMPKLFAHYGAGHLTLIYAVCWTPWLLIAAIQAKDPIPRKWFSQPGVILAVIFLADVRWAAFAGVLWLGWEIAHSHIKNKQVFLRLMKQFGLAALLSAPLVLPLLEYSRLSTRASLSQADVLTYSLPPARLLGFLFPDFGGNHEWIVYPGALVISLAFLVVLWPSLRRKVSFWVWTAVISVFISLGEFIPFLSILTRLPGISALRVPPRALFITGFALAVLAAYALQGLIENVSQAEIKRARLGLAALSLFGLIFTLVVWVAAGELPINFVWGAGGLLVGFVWLNLWFRGGMPPKIWLLGLIAFSLLDWGVMDLSLFSHRPATLVLNEGAEVAEFLAQRRDSEGLFRVYSPSYSLPQQTAAYNGLELADGVDPLQLEAYASYMEMATGVPRSGYSITLPPIDTIAGQTNVATANAAYLPNLDLLALLNVKYITAHFVLTLDGLLLVDQLGSTLVYENQAALPRAWVQPAGQSPGEDFVPAEVTYYSPNSIILETEGPGLLVLSEINYPGWRVYVDGHKAEMLSPLGLLRGVELDEGRHEIEFVFRPTSVYLGTFLAVGTLLFFIAYPLIYNPNKS
ncbi:MAG: YfhO family protein [Chloroflexi bacterium]|nr:YfhO family protein [Chloroflexota bacterium]